MSVNTETISLSSNDLPKLNAEAAKKVTAKITQVKKWKKHAKVVQILDKTFLHITQFEGSKKTYWVNIISLSSNWKRKLHIEWKWLILSVALLALSYAAYTTASGMQLFSKYKYLESTIIASVTIGLIFFVTFINKIQNSTVFYSRKSKIPLFEIYHNAPSKAEYRRFLELLSVVNAKLKESVTIPEDRVLAGELEDLRRLKDARVLSDSLYNKARQRLLSGH
ncbi:MAG: hypothetical protein OEZ68_15925 [Gammaproteobacteria bacterium]|nr:hypothetical protein [Gammaproteobacteria bacterium]MDH5802290.1 hypothetical protein [Gammaproteobacteria bacterium]